MKEKYLINARIIDPKNQIDEVGGLIVDQNGCIKAAGKKSQMETYHLVSIKLMLKSTF